MQQAIEVDLPPFLPAKGGAYALGRYRQMQEISRP